MKGEKIVCLMVVIALIVFSGCIEEKALVKALESTPFTETPKVEEEMDSLKPYDIAISTSLIGGYNHYSGNSILVNCQYGPDLTVKFNGKEIGGIRQVEVSDSHISYFTLNQHEEELTSQKIEIIGVNSYGIFMIDGGTVAMGEWRTIRIIMEGRQSVSAETAEEWKEKGISLAMSGEYEKAIECFDKAIELNPNYADAYYDRGLTYYQLKRYEKAIEDYNKAIELNLSDAEAYYDRGLTYHKLKRYERAIEDYTKAIELDPNLAEAYCARGHAYFYSKQYEKAVEDYTKAIELGSNLTSVYENRELALRKLEEQKAAQEKDEPSVVKIVLFIVAVLAVPTAAMLDEWKKHGFLHGAFLSFFILVGIILLLFVFIFFLGDELGFWLWFVLMMLALGGIIISRGDKEK